MKINSQTLKNYKKSFATLVFLGVALFGTTVFAQNILAPLNINANSTQGSFIYENGASTSTAGAISGYPTLLTVQAKDENNYYLFGYRSDVAGSIGSYIVGGYPEKGSLQYDFFDTNDVSLGSTDLLPYGGVAFWKQNAGYIYGIWDSGHHYGSIGLVGYEYEDNVPAINFTASSTVGIGTTTPVGKLHVSAGESATTTTSFGEIGSDTSHACFNTKNTDGDDISFYFVGVEMKVENNVCR